MIRRISFGAKASHRERFLIHEQRSGSAIVSALLSETIRVIRVLPVSRLGFPHVEHSEHVPSRM